MRVMVTGGAGFLGSRLVGRLLEGGNAVTVYDNFSSGRKEFIQQHLGKKDFALIEADLLDREELLRAMGGSNTVYHVLQEGGYGGTRIVYTEGRRGWKGDVSNMLLDIGKINRLGWRACRSSQEAVREAARTVLAERPWRGDSETR